MRLQARGGRATVYVIDWRQNPSGLKVCSFGLIRWRSWWADRRLTTMSALDFMLFKCNIRWRCIYHYRFKNVQGSCICNGWFYWWQNNHFPLDWCLFSCIFFLYKTVSGALSDLGIGWERITLLLQKKVHFSTLQTSFQTKPHMALRLVRFKPKF